MGYRKRLDRAFEDAPCLPLCRGTRYILMSDCHRGTGMSYDNFLKNQHLYFAALRYYYAHGFHYIELGDGEELWENRERQLILDCHSDVYWMFSKFEEDCRICRLYGNHDMELKKDCPQSLILENREEGLRVWMTHGHQAEWLNSTGWRLSRFLVRYLWRPLEQFGVLDPTSAARNYKKAGRTEKRLMNYAAETGKLLITGHTHRPRLPKQSFCCEEGEGMYLNTGSCVHPRCITGIEILGTELYLIKWAMTSGPDLNLYVSREVLDGPLTLRRA
ncbi:MAG: metallophosphoesterase family protein [Lachnospiraceae bacterium]